MTHSNFLGFRSDGALRVRSDATIGATIAEAIMIAARWSQMARDAVDLLGSGGLTEEDHRRGREVRFEFSGVTVAVLPDSDVGLILRDW